MSQTVNGFHQFELPFGLDFTNQTANRVFVRGKKLFGKRIVEENRSSQPNTTAETLKVVPGPVVGVIAVDENQINFSGIDLHLPRIPIDQMYSQAELGAAVEKLVGDLLAALADWTLLLRRGRAGQP